MILYTSVEFPGTLENETWEKKNTFCRDLQFAATRTLHIFVLRKYKFEFHQAPHVSSQIIEIEIVARFADHSNCHVISPADDSGYSEHKTQYVVSQ